MYAVISDGLRTRYLYAPELVHVIAAAQQTVLDISFLSGAIYAIGVNGLPGQTMVLQSSADLHNWYPVATNMLASSRWVYTNSLPATASALFYRAALIP
jgi:hypothetical protein